MFERFTDRARRVLVLAQEEARTSQNPYIGTEHVLFGLIREGEGVAHQALESLGVTLAKVRPKVEEIIGRGDPNPAEAGSPPFTPRAKKVLELSLREVLALRDPSHVGDTDIGTGHLLLGLLREGEGVATQALVGLGFDPVQLRQRVLEFLSEGRSDPVTTDDPWVSTFGRPSGSMVSVQASNAASSNSPLGVAAFVGFIPVTNLDFARAFYCDVLRLALLERTPGAIVVRAGRATLRLTEVPDFQPQPFTIAGWLVDDISSAVEALATAGVTFNRYDGMRQDEQGIWTAPTGDCVAWFADPDGNVLSITASAAWRNS